MLLNKGGERTLEIILAASLKKKNLPTECTRGFLSVAESAPRLPECREWAIGSPTISVDEHGN